MTEKENKKTVASGNIENEIYFLKVKHRWAAYWPREKYPITVVGSLEDDLTSFTKAMQILFEDKFKIKPRFRCIRNKGVEDYIKEQIMILNLVNNRSKEI